MTSGCWTELLRRVLDQSRVNHLLSLGPDVFDDVVIDREHLTSTHSLYEVREREEVAEKKDASGLKAKTDANADRERRRRNDSQRLR